MFFLLRSLTCFAVLATAVSGACGGGQSDGAGGAPGAGREGAPGGVIGNNYVVRDGLNAGERLITGGIQKIGDGVPVSGGRKVFSQLFIKRPILATVCSLIVMLAGAVAIPTSSTNTGFASINVTFEIGRDPDLAAVDVQNRVNQALGRMPAGARTISSAACRPRRHSPPSRG